MESADTRLFQSLLVDFWLKMCLPKYRDLLSILKSLLAKPKYWRRLLYMFREHEVLTTYNDLRDSVLLLRDLSSKCVDYLPQTFFCKPDNRTMISMDTIQRLA